MKKNKYKLIEEGGKEYVLASQAVDYAKEYFNTSFDIPSYRTLRYYVTNGVIDRPQKRAKETYFETNYLTNAIGLLRKLRPLNPTLTQIRGIVPNIKRYGEWEEVFKILEMGSSQVSFTKTEGKNELLSLLATEKPSDIIKGKVGIGKTRFIKGSKFSLE